MTDIWGQEPRDVSQIAEADFGALLNSRRTVAGKGKADIGGRLRVATILRKAGITNAGTPERIAGSTNEVWRAGEFIIRVGMVPGANRLRREAQLVRYLPWGTNYPAVVTAGEEPFGEWLIVRRLAGVALSDFWASADRQTRRRLTHDLARGVKDIHQTVLSPEVQAELAYDENSKSEMPHVFPPALVEMLSTASEFPWIDTGLVAALLQKTNEVANAFDGTAFGLVHGDLHFENVLVNNGILASILDFEWCRPGPAEIDLDVLARFCEHPDLTVGGVNKADRDSYRPVLGWICEVYPELFSAANLRDRLMLCALAAEIPWLIAMPPTGPAHSLSPFHPVNRLRELLDRGTAAERLGWAATGI